MNILHISPNFNFTCGVSKYLTLILPELKKQSDINIYFITNGGDSLERLEKIGIDPTIIKFKTGLRNILYVRNNLKDLESFCRENKIEIIHTHHRYPEFLANRLKERLEIKTVTTVHSLVRGSKRISFKSDLIIAVSKAVEKNLIENFDVNPDKIIQIYNPIDFNLEGSLDDNNSNKDGLNILSGCRVILFIGRDDKNKGLDLLLKAFNKISNEYDDVVLVIVSDLSEKQKKRIQFSKRRIFTFEPQNNIKEFYKRSEILILPSHVESFPYVMLEAGVYGTLFLGSNVGGIDEFIQDGINGFKFNSGDVNDLYEKIKLVLSLIKEDREIVKKNLFNKVLELDSPETYAKKLITIYSQLLKS